MAEENSKKSIAIPRFAGWGILITGAVFIFQSVIAWGIGKLLDTLNPAFVSILTEYWSELVGFILIVLGFLFLKLYPEKDEVVEEGVDPVLSLGRKGGGLASRIENYQNPQLPDFGVTDGSLVIDCLALMKSFEKEGFPTFEEEDLPNDLRQGFGLFKGYFTIASGFIAAGHEDVAHARLREFTTSVKEDAANSKATQ